MIAHGFRPQASSNPPRAKREAQRPVTVRIGIIGSCDDDMYTSQSPREDRTEVIPLPRVVIGIKVGKQIVDDSNLRTWTEQDYFMIRAQENSISHTPEQIRKKELNPKEPQKASQGRTVNCSDPLRKSIDLRMWELICTGSKYKHLPVDFGDVMR